MLKDNLKNARKRNGLTQETVAAKMNIARQTLSSWERGLSVPDAESLERLAEIYNESVSSLLGSGSDDKEQGVDKEAAIAGQLSRINEELAEKNHRSRKVWKAVRIILFAFITLICLLILFNLIPDGSAPATAALAITIIIPIATGILLLRL